MKNKNIDAFVFLNFEHGEKQLDKLKSILQISTDTGINNELRTFILRSKRILAIFTFAIRQ